MHGQGYLHRDLKPANIVIRAVDGEPVLIDFGAARAAARERTHTRVLTPEYAPIEQHGSEGAQGPPTDIYALAAVSYRALTGTPPPSAPDRVLDDRYEPLSDGATGSDRAWLAAIDQGLSLRPEDRPQTVAAWRTALILQAHNEPAEANARAAAAATSSRSWKARTAEHVAALAPSEAAASATLSRFWHGSGSSDDHPPPRDPPAAPEGIAGAAPATPDVKSVSTRRARTWSGILVAAACAGPSYSGSRRRKAPHPANPLRHMT